MFSALSSGWIQAGVADRLFVETRADNYNIVKSSIYFAPLKYHFATARDVPPAVIRSGGLPPEKTQRRPWSVYWGFIGTVFNAQTVSRIPTIIKWSLILAVAFLS